MLPPGAYAAVARAVMVNLGDAVMDLLTDEAIPAYNMYALFRLAQDVARLRGFVDACGDVPGMAVRCVPSFVPPATRRGGRAGFCLHQHPPALPTAWHGRAALQLLIPCNSQAEG